MCMIRRLQACIPSLLCPHLLADVLLHKEQPAWRQALGAALEEGQEICVGEVQQAPLRPDARVPVQGGRGRGTWVSAGGITSPGAESSTLAHMHTCTHAQWRL